MKDEIKPKENSRCTRLKAPVTGGKNHLRIMIVAIILILAAISIGPAMGQVVQAISSGVWTAANGGSGVTGINTQEVRWGIPAETYKSGLRFDGQSVSSTFGQEFCLGKLSHFNYPITDAASGATLKVKMHFTDPSLGDVFFTYNMAIDETPNSGTCSKCKYSPCSVPCPDKISWPAIPPDDQVFTIGSDTYTLQIVGIKDACPSGALKTDFITQEGRTNEGYLVGRIVRVSVPVANDDAITTPEDTPVTASATGNDIPSSDGGNVWSLVGENGGAAHGTVTMTAEGTYTYTPGADWSGVDTFNYKICDVDGSCDPAVVTVTVTPVNDLPVANDDSVTTPEDTPVTASVTGNDVLSGDGGNTWSRLTDPADGDVVFSSDGSYTYTPDADWSGIDSFTYEICDVDGDCDPATVTIKVNPVNDLPVANDDSVTTPEDTPVTASVTGNDVLSGDGGNTWSKLTDPANGDVVFNSDGSYTYTPDADWSGIDSFTYEICDVDGDCDPATVTITVTPVNDCPVAVDDGYEAVEDETLTVTADLGVLVNDEDEDSSTLTIASFDATSVNGGTVVLNTDGSFVYTPAADFCGEDTFTYKVTDGICAPGSQDVGTVTINVECVEDNICPVAMDDEYEAIEDIPLNVPVDTGVLGNDEDANVGDTLTVASYDATSVNGGTVVLNTDGSFLYTPAADFCGEDSFTYKVTDGICAPESQDVGTVTINVECVEDNVCPEASDDEYVTPMNTLLVIGADKSILLNDEDVDGDSLTAVLVTRPSHGTLTLNPGGSFNYKPATGFTGIDTFTYRVFDGECYSEPATVTIRVAKCPWSIVNELYSGQCGVQKVFPASEGVLANDPVATAVLNPGGITIDPKYGTIEVHEDGSFVFNPLPTIKTGTYVQFKYSATNGVCEAKYQGIAKILVSCPCP